jgi:hypothetical protein
MGRHPRFDSGPRLQSENEWSVAGLPSSLGPERYEARQKLTIGKREGSFRRVLQERTFRIVWVAPGHGGSILVTGKTGPIIHYSGQAVSLSTFRRAAGAITNNRNRL